MLYNSFFPLLFAPLLAASEIPFKEYILAPPSRIIRPSIIYGTNGTVSGALPGTLTLGAKSSITYDFGKNIAGWVTLVVEDARNASSINVTFSESSLWISSEHCDATADAGFDEPLVFEIDGEGEYSAPWERERGAFRYMSIVASEEVVLGDAWVYFTAMPHWGDDALQDYTGWFHCDDNQLNRIWYAGAYTNQLDTIDPLRGDALIFFQKITHTSIVNGTLPWYNNFTITNGSSALTDGAKRDRLVWAGDMAIAVPGLAVSTFDLVSVANSLDSLFALQLENGMLPYAGTPFNEAGAISFTYHLYTLIGVADYYHWSGNLTYLQAYWPAWKDAMSWSVGHVDSSGLANITSPSDWLRFGMGGYNIEANSILYFTLNLGISLASTLNDTTVAETYSTYMTGIKSAANFILWDDKASLYKDNETDTTLHPQDGNVWAIKSGIIPTPSRANEISAALRERWTPYGAPAPEAADAISPFISGFELEAHFMANETQNALDLMRMMWGDFMLDDPRMTNSTFIEGYSTTGELHYAPYTNDARISHAHGWATGPTSTMTIFIVGIKLTSEAGRTWSITPQTGDLKYAEAGFSTSLGLFSSSWRFGKKDSLSLNISTPEGTSGDVGIPTGGKDGIVEVRGRGMKFRMKYTSDEYDRFWIQGLEGGDYEINVWRK